MQEHRDNRPHLSIVELASLNRERKKPEDIPTDPDKYYPNQWKGWGDWLGMIE
jgi:hypothetical protein